LEQLRFLPTLKRYQIDLSASHEFVRLLRDLSHSDPLLRTSFHRATDTIKPL